MSVTVSVDHLSSEVENYRMTCPQHGETAIGPVSTDSEDAMWGAVLLLQVLHKHERLCECPMGDKVETWLSLDECLALHRSDAASDRALALDPAAAALHAHMTGILATMRCDCSPGVRITASRASGVTVVMIHRSGCPERPQVPVSVKAAVA